LRSAARLFALTEPEGYIRVYLDAGPPMKQTLKRLREAPYSAEPGAAVAISRPYVSRLLAVFEQEEQRLAQAREASPAHLPNHQRVILEPLSRQEQQVLRRLCAGQTYAEIAEALVVSPNTIKTQVSSIYRKLGVNRRAEAIAMSQRLHLL